MTGVANLVDPARTAPSVRRGGLEPTAALREFVARQRLRNASWQGVAKMIGFPEPDVRAVFDPEYLRVGLVAGLVPVAKPPSGDAARAAPPYGKGRPYGKRGELGAMALDVIAALGKGAPLTPVQIARVTRETNVTTISARLTRLKARGWVEQVAEPRSSWQLTAKGRAKAKSLAEAAD